MNLLGLRIKYNIHFPLFTVAAQGIAENNSSETHTRLQLQQHALTSELKHSIKVTQTTLLVSIYWSHHITLHIYTQQPQHRQTERIRSRVKTHSHTRHLHADKNLGKHIETTQKRINRWSHKRTLLPRCNFNHLLWINSAPSQAARKLTVN